MEGIYFCYNCIKVIYQNQLINRRQIVCPFCQSLEVEIYTRDDIEVHCLDEPDSPIAYSDTLNHAYDMLLHQIDLILNNEPHFDPETLNENDYNYIMERDENNYHHATTDEDYNNTDSSDNNSLDDDNEYNEENSSSIYFSDNHQSYLSDYYDTDTSAFYWHNEVPDINDYGIHEYEYDEDDDYSYDDEEQYITDEDSDDNSLWETLDEDEDDEGEINDNNDTDDDGTPNLPELLTSMLLSEQRETDSLPDTVVVREARINIFDVIQNSFILLENRFRSERMVQDYTLLTQFIDINFSQFAEPNPRQAIVDLSKLKQRNLKDGDSLLKTKTECIICQEVYEVDICVAKMPCNHEYHQECLIHWLKQSPTCPMCRHPINSMDNTN